MDAVVPAVEFRVAPGVRVVELHDENALRLPYVKFWHHTDPGAQTLKDPLDGTGFIEGPASSNSRPHRAKPAELDSPSDRAYGPAETLHAC